MKQKNCLEIPELLAESTTPAAPGFYEYIFKVYKEKNDDKEFFYYNITNKIQLPKLNPDFFLEVTPTSRMPLTSFANILYNPGREINNRFVLWWLVMIFNPDKIGKFFVDPDDTFIVLKTEYVGAVIDSIIQNG